MLTIVEPGGYAADRGRTNVAFTCSTREGSDAVPATSVEAVVTVR